MTCVYPTTSPGIYTSGAGEQAQSSSGLNSNRIMMLVAKLMLLTVAAGLSSAYRAPNPRPGSYSLPNIGKYPAPTQTFPGRNQGLPPVYHGKFKRAVEDYVGEGGDAAFDEEPVQFEAARLPRSVGLEDHEEFVQAEDELPELTRYRREPQRFIQPTYRPGRNGPRFIQPTFRPSRNGPTFIQPTFRPEPRLRPGIMYA